MIDLFEYMCFDVLRQGPGWLVLFAFLVAGAVFFFKWLSDLRAASGKVQMSGLDRFFLVVFLGFLVFAFMVAGFFTCYTLAY